MKSISIILDKNREKIINLYNSNISIEKIAKEYNCSPNTIFKSLNKWQVKERNKIYNKGRLEGKDDQILSLYKNGKNCVYIAKELNVTRTAILYWGKKRGLNFSHIPNIIPKYNLNHKFFENIDNEDKAYILGLYFTDGIIKNNRFILGMCDLDVIEKVKNKLEYDGVIYLRKQKKDLHIIDISSPKAVEDLKRMGCVEKKSLILNFPYGYIPDHLMTHFIRGLFDGDGCIYFHKRAKKYYIDIVGTRSICEGCFHFLNIGSIRRAKNNFKNTYRWESQNSKDVKRFLNYIYKDATIYMNRKKVLADKCLKGY